ncbi:carboxypeptidase regulatory-like domain-containing protein [Candidatus Bathyarchaeota archaeon]|nr:carboxypeptidase regulatory-like domain-containing protein [Candidatus Bathyarchaeota archaeon]
MVPANKRCFHNKFLLPALLLSIIFFVSPILCEENDSSNISKISGYVVDAISGTPIQNATIIINSLHHLNTDSNGFFCFKALSEGWYNIYVFYDRPETKGIDYVPSLWKIYVEKGVNAYKILALWPGASIKIEGKIRFVDKLLPVSWFKFTVQPPGGAGWGDEYSVDEYGIIDSSNSLNLDSDLIIIPADIPVSVMVEVRLPDGTRRAFTLLNETAIFVLKQGSQETLNIEKFCLMLNVESVRDLLNQNLDLLQEAINAGFLVEEEQKRVHRAESLLNSLEALTSEGSYEEAFALLRNAYVSSKSTLEDLKDLFVKSSRTSVFSIFFISLLSLTIAYLVAERGAKLKISLFIGKERAVTAPLRAVVIPAIYISLLMLFFLSFPGCRLISPALFVLASFFLFVISLVIISVLPKTIEGKKQEDRSISGGSLLVFAFSIASGNLKRRKLRSSLNLLSFTILVLGFIVFTSISPSYGFTSIRLGPSKMPLNIIMISNPPLTPEFSFAPLTKDLLRDLESNPNIISIAPKIENFPSFSPIDYLYSSSGKSKPIYGLLGISARYEATITYVNETIVEGRCFNDDEDDGALISKSLAEYLEIKVQDSITRALGVKYRLHLKLKIFHLFLQ